MALVLILLAGVVAAAVALHRWQVPLADFARRRPQSALWLCAVLSGLVASYPVVFCGKSFVSPNTHAMLHASPPTVPGYSDTTVHDLHVGDPAAILWQNLGYSVVGHDAIVRDHSLPLWNRYLSAGSTLIGQGQSMLGDPAHLLVIAANGASWAWDAKFVLAKVLFAAGLAYSVWRVTRGVAAALVLATVAPFVGFFNFRFNHPAVFTVAYAPWIFAAWVAIARAFAARGVRRAMLLLVIANVALIGSGTVKEALALLVAMNAVGAGMCLLLAGFPNESMGSPQIGGDGAQPSGRRRFALALATLACTAAIAAPLWMPFAEALRTSATSYDIPQVSQVPLWQVIGLVDNLWTLEINPEHRIVFPGINLVLFFGVAYACLQSRRSAIFGRPVALLTGAAAIALAFVFGIVPAKAILAIPLLRNVYHIHNTFGVVAVVVLSLTAGIGFHVARVKVTHRGSSRPAAIALVALAGLAAYYFANSGVRWALGLHVFFYANLALVVIASVVLVAIYSRRVPENDAEIGRRRYGIVSVIFVSLAGAVLLYRHGLHLDFGFGGHQLTYPMVRAKLNLPSPAIEAARADAGPQPFRLIGTDATLIPGFNAVYRIEGINGPDALMNPYYRELGRAAGVLPQSDWLSLVMTADVPRTRPILDFLGVRYLISANSLPTGSGYEETATRDFKVYRSATAWPRAFFAPTIHRYSDVRHLLHQVEIAAAPFVSVQNGDAQASAATADLPEAASTRDRVVPARNYKLTNNSTSFTLSAPGPGVVVLQEAWLPRGFRATIDGSDVPIFRANHAFKGIRIPHAGDYAITFRYAPPSFAPALWIAVAGALALIGIAVRFARSAV